LSKEVDLRYITVDSNGLIPLGLTEKAPYNAYFFRKIMQKHFIDCYTSPPKQDPLDDLENQSSVDWAQEQKEAKEESSNHIAHPADFIASLDIDHDILPIELKGTRQAALGQLGSFIQHNLEQYDDKRNDPDAEATSGMSPWLHFGKVSEYEIVQAVLGHQPKNWDLDNITFNGGSTGGCFNGNPNVDSFRDEVSTWREGGVRFAAHGAADEQKDAVAGGAV